MAGFVRTIESDVEIQPVCVSRTQQRNRRHCYARINQRLVSLQLSYYPPPMLTSANTIGERSSDNSGPPRVKAGAIIARHCSACLCARFRIRAPRCHQRATIAHYIDVEFLIVLFRSRRSTWTFHPIPMPVSTNVD